MTTTAICSIDNNKDGSLIQDEKAMANQETTHGKATGSQAPCLTAVGASARHPEILIMTASKRGLEQPNKMRSDTKKKRNPDTKIPDRIQKT